MNTAEVVKIIIKFIYQYMMQKKKYIYKLVMPRIQNFAYIWHLAKFNILRKTKKNSIG